MTQRYRLDTLVEEFDSYYNNVFRQFCCNLVWQKELSSAMIERQKAIDADYTEARRINAETEAMRRQGALDRANIIRQSNQEIADIQRSAYQNQQRATDRANKRWSETFNGRYTYTDHYGDEYQASGYGRYAYKKGDTIINTDDPVSPGYDWEELKKKY